MLGRHEDVHQHPCCSHRASVVARYNEDFDLHHGVRRLKLKHAEITYIRIGNSFLHLLFGSGTVKWLEEFSKKDLCNSALHSRESLGLPLHDEAHRPQSLPDIVQIWNITYNLRDRWRIDFAFETSQFLFLCIPLWPSYIQSASWDSSNAEFGWRGKALRQIGVRFSSSVCMLPGWCKRQVWVY